ncbi:MAG TPA: hypothetical protein ENJ94_01290 [Gammaproteobacteria bacterium]|nr:hypothetical protein [Gammaproteobacteria bacterium]
MIEEAAYFDTPQRNERLRLLMHLVANAEEIPYLRAPPGAGKTTFAKRLAAHLKPDYTVVWTMAGARMPLRDQIIHALDLPQGDGNWLSGAIERDPAHPLLVMVDDADLLQLAEIADLLDLVQAGARLLLVGTGELARARGDWDIQFVDLPPFSEEESRAFIEAHTVLPDGAEGERMAIALHRASEGLPGLILDALDTLPGELPEPEPAPSSGVRWLWIAGGGLLALLVGVLLWFQEDINRLMAPAPPADETVAESAPSADEPPAEAPVFRSQVVAPAPDESHPKPQPLEPDAPPPEVAAEPAGSEHEPQSEPAEPDPLLDAIVADAIHAASQPLAEEMAGEAPPERPAVDRAAPAEASEDALAAVMADAAAAGPGKQPAASVRGEGEGSPPAPAPKPVTAPPAPSQKAAPAPSSSKTKAPAAQPAKAAAVPSGGAHEPPAPASRPQKGGLAWLKAQPRGRYTLQLLGARDREAIRRFVRRHRIPQPWAVFERELDGKPWYSLVAGSYPDRAAAVAARARLPAAIARAGVWPRTFGSIQAQLQGQ